MRGARIEAEPTTLPIRAGWPQRLGAIARRNLLELAAMLRPGRNAAAGLPPPAIEPPTPAAWPKSPDLPAPD
jgi:hypothetical protein